jgi:hypothetical protein
VPFALTTLLRSRRCDLNAAYAFLLLHRRQLFYTTGPTRVKNARAVLLTGDCAVNFLVWFSPTPMLVGFSAGRPVTQARRPSFYVRSLFLTWTAVNAFDSVIADSHRVPGAIWSLGNS